jgi:hypothetical protein
VIKSGEIPRIDGKWKDSRILMDNFAMLQQLGVLPQTLTAATR